MSGNTPATSSAPPRHPRLPLGTLACLLLIYLLGASGRIGDVDAETMLDLGRSLLDGRIDIPASPIRVTGIDGRTYSHFGPLTSVVWTPFILAGRMAHAVIGRIGQAQWEEFFVSFCSPLLAGSVLWMLAVAWRREGVSTRHSAHGLWMFGLATLLWPYSKREGSDMLMAACLLGGWIVGTGPGGPRAWVGAGACFGAAFLARIPAPVLITPLTLAIAHHHLLRVRRTHPATPVLPHFCRVIAWVLAGFLPSALAQLAYNHARFGHPLEQRYAFMEPFRIGFDLPWLGRLWGMLVQHEHGLIWFMTVPLAVFALAVPGLRRRGSVLAWLVPVLLAGQLLLLSGYDFWGGGICFGSRLFLFIAPFTGLAWPVLDLSIRGTRIVTSLAAGLGILVSVAGVLVHPLLPATRSEEEGTLFVPNHARELARFAGLEWGQPSESLRRSARFQHGPLRLPDIWWCQAISVLRHGQPPLVEPGSLVPPSSKP